jgi:hypothetical protein
MNNNIEISINDIKAAVGGERLGNTLDILESFVRHLDNAVDRNDKTALSDSELLEVSEVLKLVLFKLYAHE